MIIPSEVRDSLEEGLEGLQRMTSGDERKEVDRAMTWLSEALAGFWDGEDRERREWAAMVQDRAEYKDLWQQMVERCHKLEVANQKRQRVINVYSTECYELRKKLGEHPYSGIAQGWQKLSELVRERDLARQAGIALEKDLLRVAGERDEVRDELAAAQVTISRQERHIKNLDHENMVLSNGKDEMAKERNKAKEDAFATANRNGALQQAVQDVTASLAQERKCTKAQADVITGFQREVADLETERNLLRNAAKAHLDAIMKGGRLG